MRWRTIPVALVAGALAGCTVGPDYRRPDLQTPAAFSEAGKTAATAQGEDLGRWWTRFNDPVLDRLVERALAGNPDLQTAASRIRQARQQEIVQAAAGLPQVTANGNFARLHSETSPLGGIISSSSGQQGGGGAAGAADGPIDRENYAAGFDATWEIDVFGKVRRGVESARAATESQVWRLRDTQVSLSAEVANDYLTYRALQLRIAIAQDELKSQRDIGKITGDRARFGLTTRLDVNQQDVQIAQTSSQIPQLQAQARAQVHALGVLLGQAPEALNQELQSTAPLPGVPPVPGTGLPSELLQRRPDIRAAERQLASATATIGVQTAALYPSFNLLTLATFAAPNIGQVFNTDAFTGIGIGSARWSLFTAGRTRANIAAAREQANQAWYAYKTAVLVALRDVEDALARQSSDTSRLKDLQGQLAAGQRSLVIARDQYVAGLTPFNNVLSSEQSVLGARDQVAQQQAQLATDLVSLYKALGGGWDQADAARIQDKGGAPY